MSYLEKAKKVKFVELTFRQLQEEHRVWAKRNFPDKDPYEPLLGVVEEVGELSHAHLKSVQGIRGTKEEHAEKAKDAIGDIIVFLADYCTENGYDMQDIIETVWAEVKQRDWKKNPKDADKKVDLENISGKIPRSHSLLD